MKSQSYRTKMRHAVTILAAAALCAVTACREEDGPLAGASGKLVVTSDPSGARVIIDEVDTGLRTPVTIADVGGQMDVEVIFDSGGARYSYSRRVTVSGNLTETIHAPLAARCGPGANLCIENFASTHIAGNFGISVNALGAIMLEDGIGGGLLWPSNTNDSYVSNGMPMIAAKLGGHPVALGMYDTPALAGRPALDVDLAGGALRTDQKTWIAPTSSSTSLVTIRGIEVREEMMIDPAAPDIVLIKLTYRNITNSPTYQLLDARGGEFGAGLTYDDVYVGFGLDPDIGVSSNDLMAYDPERQTVFAYDADFSDNAFTSGAAQMPGIVGLRLLSAPSGARTILNGYGLTNTNVSRDWHAGTSDEGTGWSVLSGTAAYTPDDPDPNIGNLVTSPTDVRILVSAGPYTLRPADEITIVVAVALARPKAGTFTPGTVVSPGLPSDGSRQILVIAADLRARLLEAESLLPHFE